MTRSAGNIAEGEAPIIEALRTFSRTTAVRFHTPGHKGGHGAHRLLRHLVGRVALSLDVGLTGDLDNLQDPKSWIAKAERLAAELYSASRSYFLVNGTTSGCHAMILSAVGPKDKILVARNVHRSIASAIVLSGSVPTFVLPEFDDSLHLPLNVSASEFESAIAQSGNFKALVLTNPTYHGIATDLVRIAHCAHRHHIPVLVDEAHGSHLAFSKRLPISAMEANADLCVQSCHKIIGSLTQSSILHVKGEHVDISRLESMLRLLQTTSPSYLLLASLDIARLQMARDGRNLVSRAVALADATRQRINALPLLHCMGQEHFGQSRSLSLDSTKVTLVTVELGISGNQVARLLSVKHGVQSELADEAYLLLLVTIGDTEQGIRTLMKALKRVAGDAASGQKYELRNRFTRHVFTSLPDASMSPREAAFAPRRRVPLLCAAGEVSAEVVSAYPPGIPVLWPGERIDEVIVDYCNEALRMGTRLVGIRSDQTEKSATLEVVS